MNLALSRGFVALGLCILFTLTLPTLVASKTTSLKRAVTPDNTCGLKDNGNGKGYTCNPADSHGGACCSAHGYCGNLSNYCGDGCQPEYGACDSPPYPPSNTTNISTDERCGPDASNGQICPQGQCCSLAGYCGIAESYCQDPICQFGYGRCDSSTTPAGPRTDNVVRPLAGNLSYNTDILDCTEHRVVALSFDDGPYNYTSALLDILDKYNFTATFFISGNNLGKGPIDITQPYPKLIKRMVSSGHQVASHTWSHYDLSTLSYSMRQDQVVKNEMAFVNIIGKYPTYLRPPYSSCTVDSQCQQQLSSLGYHRLLFDLDTQDYLNPTPELIQKSKDVVANTLNGADAKGYQQFLSIQHDTIEQSVANLSDYYFGLIRQKGWRGVTVGECLGDPRQKWYRYPNGSSGA